MRKREQSAVPAVGGSSLLVIFAVLCLTVFALLGLSAVQAYGRLSEASVQAVSALPSTNASAGATTTGSVWCCCRCLWWLSPSSSSASTFARS